MATWDKNNDACLNVWTTLHMMNQLQQTFTNSGSLQMSQMLFFNPTLTVDELTFEARAIAVQLDQVFMQTCGGSYKSAVTSASAVNNMTDVLIDVTKTVNDLSDIVNNDYQFA